jgi:hypothetical protein
MADGVAGTASSAMSGVAAGAKEAAFEILDVLFLWIVPIITLIVGYLLSASIGLSGAIGTLIDGVLGTTGVSPTTMAQISCAIAVLIWGSIAGAMWYFADGGKIGTDGRKNYRAYVLRPVATLFGGFALGEVAPLFAGKVNNGMLGSFATQKAGGG